MKLYKLTDLDGRSQGSTHWEPGKTHYARGRRRQGLCSSEYIHAYRDPILAIMMAPVHLESTDLRMWEAEGEVEADDGMKVGCRSLTTIAEIPMPEVTTEQRVRFGILAALVVYKGSKFVSWAQNWLDGTDRSRDSAAAAAAAAHATAHATAHAAAAAAHAAAAHAAAADAHVDDSTLDLIAIACVAVLAVVA